VIPPCPETAPECKAGYEDFDIMACPTVSQSTLYNTQGNKNCKGDPIETVFSNQPCPEAALERKVKHLQTIARSGVIIVQQFPMTRATREHHSQTKQRRKNNYIYI